MIQTKYQIPNSELALIETKSLLKLNELRSAFTLIDFDCKLSKQLCYSNNELSLLFKSHSVNLYSKAAQVFEDIEFSEKTVWVIFEDLLDYLGDLELYGLSSGDFQPQYIFLDE